MHQQCIRNPIRNLLKPVLHPPAMKGTLDVQDFARLRARFDQFEQKRELLIAKSREIVNFSKQAIYAVHRGALSESSKLIKGMEGKVAELKKITGAFSSLDYSGSVKVAIQEYVEAATLYEFVKNRNIPSSSELNVEPEYYLLGLCDLTGELVRMAVNAAIHGDYTQALEIKDCVAEIYGEMLKFDFRNGELRKKFDGIKYDLKKLEDLALDIKLKGQ